jgi:hypothetical protein
MADIHITNARDDACFESKSALVARLAKGISLAAAPTFALMALLDYRSASAMDGMCSSGPMAPLSGMVPMYLLMSTFHCGPWFTLFLPKLNSQQPEKPLGSSESNPPRPHEFGRARRFHR